MLKNIQPIVVTVFCLLVFTGLPGCKKTEYIKASVVKPEVELIASVNVNTGTGSGSITERIKVVHLRSDTVYILPEAGFTREAGEQLIIDEGVVIKATIAGGGAGAGTNGKIIIKPGATITAKGTATNPIIFTSNKKAGLQGKNWAGIIVQGKSFNNANGTSGIADDFSGVLQYVRIEFAPLILDAVGNKTVVENVMVSYTKQETYDRYQNAFNIYGGTFNARNIISYACSGPSDFLITNGYTGSLQNVIGCRHPFFGEPGFGADNDNSLSGIFIQNNVGGNVNAQPNTNPLISNMTIIGPDSKNGTPADYADTATRGAALVTTNSACFQIRNSVFLGYPAGGWFLNDSVVAKRVEDSIAQFNYSFIQTNTPHRLFYLSPDIYNSYVRFYNSGEFKSYMLGPRFINKSVENAADFMFTNINDFDFGPGLLPLAGSPLLSGASFKGSDYFSTNTYFDKQITWIGALGKDNWLQGWTNFNPLKTNYNFPE
jgi:hypothetical protein